MAAEGYPVRVAIRVLGEPESGSTLGRAAGTLARTVRHVLFTNPLRRSHAATGGVYGVRWVRAELTLGRSLHVWRGTAVMLISWAGIRIKGVPGVEVRQALKTFKAMLAVYLGQGPIVLAFQLAEKSAQVEGGLVVGLDVEEGYARDAVNPEKDRGQASGSVVAVHGYLPCAATTSQPVVAVLNNQENLPHQGLQHCSAEPPCRRHSGPGD